MDLSSPELTTGSAWILLSYTSVGHLAAIIVAEDRGSLLVKVDIKEPY